MGCWQSKHHYKHRHEDNTNIVAEEVTPFQDEKEKEKAKTSFRKDTKDLNNSRDEIQSREKTPSKRSIFDRLSLKKKHPKEIHDSSSKSVSSSCSKEMKIEPTKEEVESWAIPNSGFETMMASEAGRELFGKFLKKEFSSENLTFWIACEELRKVTETKQFKQKVEEIFTNFLDAASPQEVSLDFKVKENVMNMRDQPEPTMFDEAQLKIYTLMHRDSFPRFLGSAFYKNYLSIYDADQADSKMTDSEIVQQDSQGMDEGQVKEEVKVSIGKIVNCESSQDTPAHPFISIDLDNESIGETKDIGEPDSYPASKLSPPVTKEMSSDSSDSKLSPPVTRDMSSDSPKSFRTVTLDTEYDKLLHLIE